MLCLTLVVSMEEGSIFSLSSKFGHGCIRSLSSEPPLHKSVVSVVVLFFGLGMSWKVCDVSVMCSGRMFGVLSCVSSESIGLVCPGAGGWHSNIVRA